METIRHVFKISKGRLKQILMVFAIIYGISLFANTIGATPIYESINNLLASSNIAKSAIIVIFIMFFLLLYSIISTFIGIFLFYSYEDFKKRQR